jgi:hypothetical protein
MMPPTAADDWPAGFVTQQQVDNAPMNSNVHTANGSGEMHLVSTTFQRRKHALAQQLEQTQLSN